MPSVRSRSSERSRLVHALLVALAAAPAAARADGPVIELSALVGAHLFSNTFRLGRDSDAPPGTAFAHTGLLGVRLGVTLGPRWSIEGELAIAPTHTRDGNSEVTVVEPRLNVLFHGLAGRVRPFVLLGAGPSLSSSSTRGLVDGDVTLAVGIGLGAKVDLGRNWGLRLDGRALLEPATRGWITEDWEVFLSGYGLFGKAQ